MCLCTVLQPFGRALVEAGKAFFNIEQERSTFRGILESHAGKCFNLFNQPCFIFCDPMFLDVLFHSIAIFCAVEKATLEKRVKELEESLASKNTESEKVAKDAAAREAEFVNRAAFLIQNVRGKMFLHALTIYPNVHRVMLTLAP